MLTVVQPSTCSREIHRGGGAGIRDTKYPLPRLKTFPDDSLREILFWAAELRRFRQAVGPQLISPLSQPVEAVDLETTLIKFEG